MDSKDSYTPAEVMEIIRLYREHTVLSNSQLYCPIEQVHEKNLQGLEILLQIPENVRDLDIKGSIHLRKCFAARKAGKK